MIATRIRLYPILILVSICGLQAAVSSTAMANSTVRFYVSHYSSGDPRDVYFQSMLRLALHKTKEQDGSFRLKPVVSRMDQDRALEALHRNKTIDVIWTMTSQEREKNLKAVRIPLVKGLYGYRVLLIRKRDQALFKGIKEQDLKKLRAVQSASWPDTAILQANNYNVVTTQAYEKMFDKLAENKVDYFPRGLAEVWYEVDKHGSKGISVEGSLLLKYTAPFYFFVNKENIALANRLERGLKLAIADGSFDRLFNNFISNKEIFRTFNLADRKIIRLENPLMSPQTPVDDTSLWYHP